jgi:hypothetical protein
VTPEIFIRCGYPLCIEDAREAVLEQFSGALEDLTHLIQGRPVEQNQLFHARALDPSNLYDQLVHAAAYIWLRGKCFGGPDRKIFRVDRRKVVRTGKYIPHHENNDYWNGPEYEPARLDNAKSHVILGTYQDLESNFAEFDSCTDTWIEARHCELVVEDGKFD